MVILATLLSWTVQWTIQTHKTGLYILAERHPARQPTEYRLEMPTEAQERVTTIYLTCKPSGESPLIEWGYQRVAVYGKGGKLVSWRYQVYARAYPPKSVKVRVEDIRTGESVDLLDYGQNGYLSPEVG